MKLYCQDCVMECYKAGLDVKDESITKDRSKCSFKQKHLIFNSDGNKVIGVGE